MYSIHGTL